MPSVLPDGIPAPSDGVLPVSARVGAHTRNFGVYVHIPFCRVRCGYCDFNTYTAEELRGAARSDFVSLAEGELSFAQRALAASGIPERSVNTVFFGGGTPTLLPAEDLVRILDTIRDQWGMIPGAEITTEANPDSVDRDYLQQLYDGGFTRVSFGMQSAVPHVLATLDRTHNPERVPLVVQWAREVGLGVSLDLIYGTPGESLGDWHTSVLAALACQPDHISAYALIVEEGTKLAGQIRRGVYPEPDDDLHADMYELVDRLLGDAGFEWYEISNWAQTLTDRSRHNLSYWTGEDWWGVGPGAHSHVGGVRWWNVKHPSPYADRINAGISPAAAREILDEETRRVESVLLRLRLAEGLPTTQLTSEGRLAVAGLIADGLLDPGSALRGEVVPTLRGRLLADTVVHRLLAETAD
ncbi:radical SAM family heme chaperone HemW [Klugiella xanthotipulae]|uniref:Heme chaperone HemW n=1 Tax=Klugiella xanthotipulae TaxID=244735 RepID=A0A543HSD9_9MICO|nr:radical SAM family heme chaperone HemW [Klugiella xanthotipulae]TQM61258.1 oxygen-independent coproporphyrinogen-3 oxidase [Klugiella xanthotipulae]